ncbi:zinc finger protein 830 [Cryptococcus gattii NT-10]|nr:zinc finger protein 830 [Cryptococcus gattii NT-10]
MDAKSLLRAKKAEARINHPYAAYNASGVLRCSICAVPVKQWDAHLLTKQHRTSVAREKAEREKSERAKRSRPETEVESGSSSKRPKIAQQPQLASREGSSEEDDVPSGLPVGFFSANNRTVPEPKTEALSSPSIAPGAATAAKTGDAELDDFLASLADNSPAPDTSAPAAPPTAISQAQANGGAKRKTTYKQDIIPGQASYEAAPVRIIQTGEEEQEEQKKEPEENEAEKRERLQREEREDIMARLEEEERAQEDADSRIMALKQRMEMLRKKREARSGVKGKGAAKDASQNA